jgi:hypothetical protein
MIRTASAAFLVLALAACGGSKPAANAAADTTSTATHNRNVANALGGAPAAAQVGVDSANNAAAQRDADVDALSREASGVTSGTQP